MGKLFLIAIIIACVAAAFIILKKKKNQEKEKKYYKDLENRERELEERLGNKSGIIDKDGVYKPYKIKYSEQENHKNDKSDSGTSVYRILRKTRRSEQQYQFNQGDTIYIGEERGLLEILNHDSGSRVYCKINYKQNEYCVKSLNGQNVKVRRGKKRVALDEVGIVLKHGDVIEIQGEEFIFQLK